MSFDAIRDSFKPNDAFPSRLALFAREPMSRQPLSREPMSRQPLSREPMSRQSLSRRPLGAGRARASRGTSVARGQAAIGFAGPIAVALLLPTPSSQIALLTDPQPTVAVGAIAMLLAITVTWLLVTWASVVVIVASASRLPGLAGAAARRVLVSIAPAAVRHIALTAVGMSVVAGLAACGSPALGSVPATPAVAVASASQASEPRLAHIEATSAADAAGTAGSHADPGELAIDLDWPLTAASKTTNMTAVSPEASTQTRPDRGAPAGANPGAAPSSPAPPAGHSGADEPDVRGSQDPGASSGAADAGAAGSAAANSAAAGTRTPVDNSQDGSGLPGDTITVRPADTITVRPGDTLWAIAATQLPSDASAADIDDAWRAWYHANRTVIGSDPNLVLPGQVLHAPANSNPRSASSSASSSASEETLR